MSFLYDSIDVSDVHVVILAGGSGTRFAGRFPKQYRMLDGKPVIRHSMELFDRILPSSHIHLVIHPDNKEMCTQVLSGLHIECFSKAGKDRKESVFNGLKGITNVDGESIILIHDAARPLVKEKDVLQLIVKAQETGAATLVKPVSNTLRRDNGDTIDRTNAWEILTPQAFRYDWLMEAHETLKARDDFTDDAGMLVAMGHTVTFVRGDAENIKITYKEDLLMAEKLLSASMQTRVGMGFDVHAFDRDRAGPVILGGLEIPHAHALKGHSDADVALHAITDALLGAIGEGDIGEHFPPTDPVHKNQDSAEFLERAVELLRIKGGALNNVDLTIICEAPKIGPHKKEMERRIADIIRVGVSQVNVKATTTEKLGFTGRKEGIAAQAVVTVELRT